ncbi:MAG TPA: DUF3488 and transglutaminase-like domain-containing protein, partial [Terriglobales bacterium]|nr:DUF3488 and transglutaminase-like domain-containing protein [Terriglobales bacterium]
LFTLLAVNTFVSMEIRRSLKNSKHYGQSPAAPHTERRLAISLSGNALMIVLAIVVGSGVLFFMLPRFSAGYLSSFGPHSDVVTGFSDNVNLGTIGRIQQTEQVVMHIQTDQPVDPDLKWRGMALTVFDGKRWSNEANSLEEQESYSGRYMLRRIEVRKLNLPAQIPSPSEFSMLRYKVVIEPLGTNIVFLAPVPIELGGRFREISIDDNGSISNTDRNHLTESYEAVSQIFQPSAKKLRSQSGKYPAGFAILYTNLPPKLDPRVGELAHQVTASAHTDYDRAAAIEQYLRENFAYTLQLPDRIPQDPIADFLFVRKRGHCEYFALTMAVMLRSIGIPSRIVNGFRNGEYNDLTGSYIVRARNAHTWVEAYIPSVGWYSFDPTPGEALPEVTTWSRMRLYLDAAQEFWREWVVNYDFGHQRSLTLSTVTKAQRTAFDLRRWLRLKYMTLVKRARNLNDRVTHDPRTGIVTLVAVALLAVILWNLRFILRTLHRRAIARRPSRAPQQAASIWYSRMLKRVARQGY